MNFMSERNLNDCAPELPIIHALNLSFFPSYLAGIIEGDGTIIVPSTERSKKGKLNYPSIQIVFDSRDFPLALVIQQKLNTGSISKKRGKNAYVLTINDKQGIQLIISLINGHMRTPKIYSFYKLIDWYNNQSLLGIEKKPINLENIINSSWLSGFIDADVHFSVRTSLIGKYTKIECKFELTQRQIDHNGYNNLEFLNFFNRIELKFGSFWFDFM